MYDFNFNAIVGELLQHEAINLKLAFESFHKNNRIEFAKQIVDDAIKNSEAPHILNHIFRCACDACYLPLMQYIVDKYQITTEIIQDALNNFFDGIAMFRPSKYVDFQISTVSFLLNRGAILKEYYMYRCVRNLGLKVTIFTIKRSNNYKQCIEQLKNIFKENCSDNYKMAALSLKLKLPYFKTKMIQDFPSPFIRITNRCLNNHLLQVEHLKKCKNSLRSKSGIKCRKIRVKLLYNILNQIICKDLCNYVCRFVGFS